MPSNPPPADPPANPPADPIVDAAWLKAHIDAPDIRIVDATWIMPGDPRDARLMHAEQRIPGAVFFDLDDISDTTSALPHMLPSAEKFASRMRKLGIGDGARIVIYDAHGIFSAARVWWMFRAMGASDVVVLDGGLPAWLAEGGPVEDGPPVKPSERHFTARLRRDLVRDLSEMRALVAKGGAGILDARPAARFSGAEPEPRAGLAQGHMPGATNVPFASLLDADKRMKSAEALAALFAPLPIDARQPPVATCGSGVTAGVVALALARVGRWDVAVYDGSWAEWGALGDTPIVKDVTGE
jgi:thiosulfate/3-mercaptopyruvate sulfurtransferase